MRGAQGSVGPGADDVSRFIAGEAAVMRRLCRAKLRVKFSCETGYSIKTHITWLSLILRDTETQYVL